MNVKQTVKKMSAVLTGAAMVGATVLGAMALTLDDYPQPLVTDGVFNGKVVVGKKAATSDVLGAVDIAASLQAESKTEVSTAGGTVTVTGGEDFDDLYLEDATLVYDTKLDKNDLDGFVDSDFDFDDSDYDYEDYITMATGAIEFRGSEYDEDFGKDIYGVIPTNTDIRYIVELDKDFNYSKVGATGSDADVEFKMLGRTIKVTNFDTNEITIEGAQEEFLEVGDSVVVDGHKVTVIKVGETSVRIDVDGETQIVDEDETEEFDSANGFEVEVTGIFYESDGTGNGASLKLGSSVSETVETGDSAKFWGGPSDDDENDWEWYINLGTVGTSVSQVGLTLNHERTDIEPADEDERNALAAGESIDLPLNYASIEYTGVAFDDFTKVTVELDDSWDTNDGSGTTRSNVWGIKFASDSGSDDFRVGGTKTDEVWVLYNSSTALREIWYKDGDDESLSAATTFTMQLDDEAFTITPNTRMNETEALTMAYPTSTTSENLRWNLTYGNDFFGATDEETGEDIEYDNGGGSYTVYGTKDNDGGYVMTKYGLYFENPDSQFSSGDSFEFFVPTERQYAQVVVKSMGTTTATSGGAYDVNPIEVGLAVLDEDAEGLLGDVPMVVVGGPYVNTIAMELMGNPTAEQIEAMFEPGKAKIKLYEDQNAILVAGYSAQDTVGASYVLADYANEDYALTGTEVEVVVPSLSDISVGTPTLPSMVDDIEVAEVEETAEEPEA